MNSEEWEICRTAPDKSQVLLAGPSDPAGRGYAETENLR